MQNEEVVRRLEELFREYLSQRGFELVEVSYRFENGRNVVRAHVDRPAGGITLDECAGLNRGLGECMEEQCVITDQYVLEICSPGLDRILKTERDFARNRGKKIKVFLTEAINGRIEIDGTVSEVSARELTLLARDGVLCVPLGKINKAKLII